MNLIKEKEILYKLASASDDEIGMEFSNSNIESYFLPYDRCRHMCKVLDIFDSENLVEIRQNLQYLWDDDKEMSKYMNCVLAALKKSQISTEGRFQDLELFNYMM